MVRYAELHCHSYYSLLDGASAPVDLIHRASELGLTALALTDHDAVYGAIPFIKAANTAGIKPILGAEMTLAGGHHLTLLVKNEQGWHNLCQLITLARHNAPKGEAILPLEALPDLTGGLIALSGCRNGEIAHAVAQKRLKTTLKAAERFQDWFGSDNFWIELQQHHLPQDANVNDALVDLAGKLKLGYVATNNVHYAHADQHRLQDVLVCIRHNTTLDESHRLRRPNSEYGLKSPDEMTLLFQDYPDAIHNTLAIAERCQFDLNYGLQDLPIFPTPFNVEAGHYLRQICEAALHNSYEHRPQRVSELLAHELHVIEQNGLPNYFLIVWGLVRFARENHILCQGRGSAANSLVVDHESS